MFIKFGVRDFLECPSWKKLNTNILVTPHPDILQYLDDPDSQEFPIQKKEFTVRESRHTAAGADRKGSKDTEEKGDIESGR